MRVAVAKHPRWTSQLERLSELDGARASERSAACQERPTSLTDSLVHCRNTPEGKV